jgi:hypothetical protein
LNPQARSSVIEARLSKKTPRAQRRDREAVEEEAGEGRHRLAGKAATGGLRRQRIEDFRLGIVRDADPAPPLSRFLDGEAKPQGSRPGPVGQEDPRFRQGPAGVEQEQHPRHFRPRDQRMKARRVVPGHRAQSQSRRADQTFRHQSSLRI